MTDTPARPKISLERHPDGAEVWSIPPATLALFGGDIDVAIHAARTRPDLVDLTVTTALPTR